MTLKRGDKGPAVEVFQKALKAWRADALPKYGVDGDFGGEMEDWVKLYQGAAKVNQTGTIDGVTAALLGRYVAKGTVVQEQSAVDLSAYAKVDHGHQIELK